MISKLDLGAYSRFFAFGCSFTSYYWPTWADIISHEIPESYNFGQTGAGNQYIFNHVIQANQYYKFRPGDLVIVCWTNVLREDRYIGNRWVTNGNIYTQKFYNPEYIEKYVDHRGFFIRDMASIAAAQGVLKNSGCDHDFVSMMDMSYLENYNHAITGDHDVVELYQDVLSQFKLSFFDALYDGNWDRPKFGFRLARTQFSHQQTTGPDHHPTTQMHKKYLDLAYPDTSWSNKTIQWLDTINNTVQSSVIRGHVFEPPQHKVFL